MPDFASPKEPELNASSLPKAPVYHNPIPVGVLLVPIIGTDEKGSPRVGVLAVRRSIPPKEGMLALPGGYIEYEDWRAAMLRELKEEAQIELPATTNISVFDAHSVDEGKKLLLFGVASPILLSDLTPFKPTAEASERVVLWKPEELAFPTHTQTLTKFFTAKMNP